MIRIFEHLTLRDLCDNDYTKLDVNHIDPRYKFNNISLLPPSAEYNKYALLINSIGNIIYDLHADNEVACFAYTSNLNEYDIDVIRNKAKNIWLKKYEHICSNVLDKYIPLLNLFEAYSVNDLVKENKVLTINSGSNSNTTTTTGNDYTDSTIERDLPVMATISNDSYNNNERITSHKQDKDLSVDSEGENNSRSTVTTEGDLINKFLAYKEAIDKPSMYERIINEFNDLFGGVIYD